jgi:hypothetical protein
MALPVAAIFAISAIASTALTAYSAFAAASAQKAQARYNAQVARNNAIVANQNAKAKLEEGRAKVDRQRIKNAQVIGAARARQAGSGFLVGGVGGFDETSDLLLTDLVTAGTLDVLTIEHNARNLARADRIRANNFRGDAAMQSAVASSISPLRSGIFAGVGAAAGQAQRAVSAGLIE